MGGELTDLVFHSNLSFMIKVQYVKEQQWFRFYTITAAANSAAHRGFGRMGGGFYNTGAGHIIAKKNQLLTNLFLLLIYNCERGIQWAGHTLECA
jgi:hypothetical protein